MAFWNMNAQKYWGHDSSRLSGRKKIVTHVVKKLPLPENLCTIYKSATMQKKVQRNDGVKL